MGRRGRKPAIGRATVEPSRPYAPRGLDDDAKSAWDSLCDDLEDAGTLDKTDRKLIELYARTYSHWARADRELAGEELTIHGESRVYLNPLATFVLSSGAKLHRILLDCGLSPSTRRERSEADDGAWNGLLNVVGDGGL